MDGLEREGKLEEFQLDIDGTVLLGFLAIEHLHISKLLVRDSENTHLAILGYNAANTPNVHLHILTAGTMANVDAKLKHREAIANQVLAKIVIRFLIPLGLGGQVEENENPHNSVFTEATGQVVHKNCGYASWRASPA